MKIMFVCLGNICRSPMAEYIMKDIINTYGGDIKVSSSATSSYNVYNGTGAKIYPEARKLLEAHGIDCSEKRAQVLTYHHYKEYDLLIGMDSSNISDMKYICKGDKDHKIIKLLDKDIEDPWYTGNFNKVYDEIYEGCMKLYKKTLG